MFSFFTASVIQLLFLASLVVCLVESKDMLRKSIIFDKKTPDVFYCPQKKPKGVDKMLVKAKPLRKLCEFEGKPLPADYKSDCYNDVDETEYACKEKHRIMVGSLGAAPSQTHSNAEANCYSFNADFNAFPYVQEIIEINN